MSPSLKQISRKTNVHYFQDGIWDIMIGLIFLLVGVAVWYDMNALSLAPLLLVFSPALIKKKVTLPRTGHIRIKKQRKTMVSVIFFALVVLLEGGILYLGVLNPSSNSLVQFFTQNLLLLSGVMIAITMLFIAWYMNFQRLYLYAGMTVLVSVVIRWWGHLAGISLTLTGLVILLIGLLVLNKFIKDHPVVADPINPTFSREVKNEQN
jgi:hypothetical protein